ncbi:MAG: DUF456 domain-containing protein [Bacteroidales bacterium]|nr:DUF456 domain-containing protein [Bacteroidales bacterium]
MDYLLLVFAIVFILLGLVGCIIPGLPGPPLSFVGIILLHFTRFAEFSFNTLFILGGIALIVQVLDYIVPIWGTKKFGGTKAGVWGSTIGLIAGIIVLPMLGIVLGPFGLIGILAGPFFGALIGELIHGQASERALVAAIGSFIGFLAGTLMKLASSVIITVYFVRAIIETL